MKQPDFGSFFHRTTPVKIKYQLRFNENLFHDMVYLTSYIHDSCFKTSSIKHTRKRIIIPIERDCWELGFDTPRGLVTTASKLTFFPVEDFSLTMQGFPDQQMTGNDAEDKFWISEIFICDDYYENNEDFHIVIKTINLRLKIHLKSDSPLVKLEDLTIPAV